jgi:ornithine cyclodeaminase
MSTHAGPVVLGDAQVRERLDAGTAVQAVRGALLAHAAGELVAPARSRAALGPGDLVFTSGRLGDRGVFGFRAYNDFVGGEHLVAVWEERGRDGGGPRLSAIVHGNELGPRRTGAIGALAVDAAAPTEEPLRIGLVGAGAQAWAQIWALLSLRGIAEVRVASRRPERAREFAGRLAAELGVTAHPADSVEDAVRDRDVVITATSSKQPVLEADWISSGTHVSCLGLKTAERHEIPPALAERADVVLTDSAAQAASGPGEPLVPAERMLELGAVLAGEAEARTSADQLTLFYSVGLAGTEVAVAEALTRRHPAVK